MTDFLLATDLLDLSNNVVGSDAFGLVDIYDTVQNLCFSLIWVLFPGSPPVESGYGLTAVLMFDQDGYR